ncbi:hypothetical protein D3C75_896160 [compost metagenome]
MRQRCKTKIPFADLAVEIFQHSLGTLFRELSQLLLSPGTFHIGCHGHNFQPRIAVTRLALSNVAIGRYHDPQRLGLPVRGIHLADDVALAHLLRVFDLREKTQHVKAPLKGSMIHFDKPC